MNVIFCENYHCQPIIYVEIKVFDVQKKLYNLPELGGGNLGNARKKSIFFYMRSSLTATGAFLAHSGEFFAFFQVNSLTKLLEEEQ